MSATASFRWPGLDRAAAAHALRLFIAAWLAFAIASLLHVHNAYWAAMPVWVVAQSSRGLLLERGLFRVLGTLIGVAAGFALLHLVHPPYLLIAALALWVGACAGMVHMLRGVHAYGALLAGMTAAVVILPSMLTPDHAIPLAIARVECTLIGVIVVTLVTGLFTPDSRRLDFYQRVKTLAEDAAALAVNLAGNGRASDPGPGRSRDQATDQSTDQSTDTAARTRRVLAEISEVEATASMVTAGSVDGYRRLRHIHALVLGCLEAIAAGQAQGQARRRNTHGPDDRDENLATRLSQALARLAQAQAALLAEPQRVDARFADVRSADARSADAKQAEAQQAGTQPAPALSADARSFGPKLRYLAPHRDWAMIRRAALVSGIGTLLAASIGLASGWAEGELAALGVCIFSMVLGSLPRPDIVAPKLLIGVVCGVVVATLYRFLVQPHIDGPTMLVLSIAPFLLIGALARASRHTAMPALDANMCFLLASQAGGVAAGATEILSGSAALLLAAAVVSTGFRLAPMRPAQRAATQIAEIRRDLRRMASDKPTADANDMPTSTRSDDTDRTRRTARQILQLMLHLGRAGESAVAMPTAMLAVLNLAQAIVDLQALVASPDAGGDEEAAAGLRMLARIDTASPPTGADLRELSAQAPDARVARALHDAADAMEGGASLLHHATP